MRAFKVASIILLLGSLAYSLAQERISRLKRVEIQFAGVSLATNYQIEWFAESDKSSEQCYRSVTIEKSPYRGLIPRQCNFFRIRSIAQVAGEWSPLHKIPPLQSMYYANPVKRLFSETTVDGKKKLFLKGNNLDIHKFASDRPLYYDLDGSGIQEYQPPLTFSEEREYNIKIYRKNPETGQYELIDEITFWVDLTPPKSEIAMYPPFYYDNGIFWFGKKTGILLRAEDRQSGLAGYYLRLQSESEALSIINTPFIRYGKISKLEQLLQDSYIQRSAEVLVLDYMAVDNAQNQEKPKRLKFRFDFEKPEVNQLTGAYKVKDESEPVTVEILVSGRTIHQDLASGIYVIPDKAQKRINDAIGTVIIRFTDKLGNATQQTIK